jgi:diguanylate cyclase (GGDEF)-like protein
LKEARFQASLRLIPATQLFTMVDVVLLVLYFWPDADHRFLLIWASITVINSCFWWYYARRASRPPLHPRAGRERLLIIHAVVEASVFSSFFFMVFPSLSPGKAVVLGAFAMGLLAAGGFSKMPLPRAAVVFVAFLGLGSGLAVGRSTLPSIWIPESLLVAFGVSIGLLVFRMSDIFDAWVGAQEDLDRQNTLISHLLEDFEESASEGLWEADANGRLTFVSPRLTDLFAIPAEELVGRRLVPWAEWAPVLEKGAAFRNLVVPVEIGRLRWWSLSAKPTKDARGNVTGWRGVGSDITGVRLQELEMVRLSRYDNLTGLLNRNSFRTLLDEPFRHNASPDLWCLVLIDLVDFKDVNESRGHLFGDALLVAVADRLKEAATGTIQLARLDGDEFALWGPLTRSVREMKKSLEYLLKHLAEPFPVAGIRHEAWFRLGVSFAPQDGGTADQWLRSADLALRTAKEQGRNQIVFFAPPMMESYRSRNTLREDLSGALSRGELSLAFQPLVDLRLGSMSGFEVLVRWDHPVRGRISPSDFIPLAEETELILTLGLWVLKQACLEARHWPPPLSISVNVSGVQLRSASLAADVAAILNEVGLAPQRLILEVTESALIKNDAALGRTFDSLKKMGIRLALDDFGTGFSALSYLQDFPFDKLKIDQSFVRPLSSSVNSPSLLAAIVSLAQSLDLSTTAEGIEEESHLSVLRSLGCDEGQGYYFSPPVTASEVPQLLLGFPVVSR